MRPVNWSNPINWNHPLNRGLVGWWLNVPHWRGGTVWHDLTKRFDGTLTDMSAVTSWVGPGDRPGGWGALIFDGADDHIALGTNAALRDLPLTYDFAVSFWFNADVAETAGGGFAWSGTDDIVIYPNDSNSGAGDIRVFWGDLGGSIINENGSDVSGEWHYLTFLSRASNDHEAYRDAVSIGTSSATGTAGPFTDVFIGEFAGQNFDGLIDDVRIYNIAPTDAAITEYYQLSQQFYPGLLNRRGRRAVVAAAAGLSIPVAMHHYKQLMGAN